MENTKAKQMLLFLWITAAVLILLSMVLWGQSHAAVTEEFTTNSDNDLSVSEMESKYLGPDSSPLRFNGDTTIEEDQLIRRDVVVVDGTIQIKGEIEGNVLCIYGDIELDENARVLGNVISIEGIIWTNEGSFVEGDIIETSGSKSNKRIERSDKYDDNDEDSDKAKRRSKRKSNISVRYRDYEYDDEPMWFEYSSVDGLTLGMKFPEPGWWQYRDHDFAILGKIGYSFARKEWQYKVGLEKWFLQDNRMAFGGEYHDLTASEDNWIITDTENTLASLLFKEDFRDHYLKEGFSVYMKNYLTHYLNFKIAYNENRFKNLPTRADWAVFGGDDKRFRPNAVALPQGLVDQELAKPAGFQNPYLDLTSYTLNAEFDTRDSYKHPQRGWYVQAFAERATYTQLENSEFDRYILDIRRYQPLGWDENLNIRLRGGTTKGDVPPMYWFNLGGLSTLRGYEYKEFTGDRMVLGNIEYRMRTSDDDWFVFDTFDIVLFVDSGLAWFADSDTPNRVNAWNYDNETETPQEPNSDPQDTFDSLTWNSLKTNVGVALATEDDEFRINFARRTDVGGRDFVVTFRINHPF